MGTPRNPGDLDPDDPYAQTALARPSFGDAAGGTEGYDGASLRAADEQALGQYDSTRGSLRVDPTGVMPGPRNVTHAVTPVGPVAPKLPPEGPRVRLGGAMPPVSAMPPTVAHPAVAPLPPPPPAPTPAAPAPRSSTGLMIALVLLGMTLGVAVAVVLLRG